MLPIQLFRTNKELVLAGLKKKNFKDLELVDKIIDIDERRRALQVENDTLAASVNAASKQIGQLMAKGEKEQAEAMKAEVAKNKGRAGEIAEQLSAMEKRLS